MRLITEIHMQKTQQINMCFISPRLYKYLFPRLTVQSEKSGGVNRKNQHRQSNYSEVNQSAGKTAAEIISTHIYERRLNRGIVFLQKHIALNNLAEEK